MKEKGYTEESYEAWRDNSADDMGIRDMDAESIEHRGTSGEKDAVRDFRGSVGILASV